MTPAFIAALLTYQLPSATSSAVAATEQPPHGSLPGLAQLVERALAANPSLAAIEANVQALDHEVARSGAWTHPRLVATYQNVPWDSFALGEEPMSAVLLRLEQQVPWFNKTEGRRSVARLSRDAGNQELAEAKIELAATVKRAYFEVGLTRQLRGITVEHVSLVAQLIDAVRIKYEVGRAAQHDLVRLEVLGNRLRDDLHDFERDERTLLARINTALHRELNTQIATPERFEPPEPLGDHDELFEIARTTRPALRMLELRAQQQRARAQLARDEAMPDPKVFAAYAIRKEMHNGTGGRDLVSVGVAVPLPLFYGAREGASAQAAEARARAAERDADALLDRISRDIEQSLANWQRGTARLRTYSQKLVPDAHRALDATFSAYQVDRASFISLFEAELELLNFERTIRRSAVEAYLAKTSAERVVGKDLSP